MVGATGRPLLITDCDEVLLHMVSHFDRWLGEAHEPDLVEVAAMVGVKPQCLVAARAELEH